MTNNCTMAGNKLITKPLNRYRESCIGNKNSKAHKPPNTTFLYNQAVVNAGAIAT